MGLKLKFKFYIEMEYEFGPSLHSLTFCPLFLGDSSPATYNYRGRDRGRGRGRGGSCSTRGGAGYSCSRR